MTRKGARLAALVSGLLIAVTLGMSAANAQDARVNVTLGEFTLIPSVTSAAAGDIEFVATNTGVIAHKLDVFKTDLAPDALPVVNGTVPEDGAGVGFIGAIDNVAAGGTASGTFTLVAGNYVLICNIAGHYAAGMRAAFTVTEASAATAPAATGTPPAAGATATVPAKAPPAAPESAPAEPKA